MLEYNSSHVGADGIIISVPLSSTVVIFSFVHKATHSIEIYTFPLYRVGIPTTIGRYAARYANIEFCMARLLSLCASMLFFFATTTPSSISGAVSGSTLSRNCDSSSNERWKDSVARSSDYSPDTPSTNNRPPEHPVRRHAQKYDPDDDGGRASRTAS